MRLTENATVARVQRVTGVGMALNIALALSKGAVGVLCRSQALVADAVHSLSDLVTDIAVLFGVRYWSAPADDEHPYGHGKIEALVSLFIGAALVIVAYELAAHAATSLLRGETAAPGLPAFFLALVSVVSKEWLFRWTRRVAREVRSTALEANAWHHRSDAISSAPVAVSVAVAHFFPSLAWIDPVGAILLSLFILYAAWEIGKPAVQELIDAGIDNKAAAVEAVARGVPGVLGVHKARARRYGSVFTADLHVHVRPDLTVTEGHDIGHAVHDAIVAADLSVADVVVHVEPAHESPNAVPAAVGELEPRKES